MSDYIFSTNPQAAGFLGKSLQAIYANDPPEYWEYHGEWGSLAVTRSHYRGFQPLETDRHIFLIIGGPVLCFRDNRFLVAEDSDTATRTVYKKWVLEGSIQWDEDLSGPFTAILVDKVRGGATIVTDLMSFIPVYTCRKETIGFFGTHVDSLAHAACESGKIDHVSLADFVLTDVVTYPYTAYENVQQLPPSTITNIDSTGNSKGEAYWKPAEENSFKSLKDAAEYLRKGVADYVSRVTEHMNEVAQFVSGGEDSRALAGVLPQHLKRDGFTFVDNLNREARIATRVADIYGCALTVGYRSKTHYLDIISEASRLVGAGHQYMHAHSLGFHREFDFRRYTAVFGGFLADTLLKGHHIRKFKGHGRVPFMPEWRQPSHNPVGERFRTLGRYIRQSPRVAERQKERHADLSRLRPNSASEWFRYYPCSMHNDMPNFYATRRLFRSYEPFMCKEAVKISAAVPQSWKLNRRLFNSAMAPYLRPSRHVLHADGRLPYYPWWANIPLQFGVWSYRILAKRVGWVTGHQAPWADWQEIFSSKEWRKLVLTYQGEANKLTNLLQGVSVEDVLKSDIATRNQKINALQVLASCQAGDRS